MSPNRTPESLDRRAAYNARWWRENGPAYNRAHPRRATRLNPTTRINVLKEDLAQQQELAKLSRRRADSAETYGRRERHWIYQSAISIVTHQESIDGEGVAL